MMVLKRAAGHLLRNSRVVARETASVSVRTSVAARIWYSAEASLARASAWSLPGRPHWAGTHCRYTSYCQATRFMSSLQI